MDTLGKRVAWARSATGLSAIKMGALIGKSPAYIRHIETDQYGLGTEAALRLASVLGVRLEWLLHGDGEAPSDMSVRRSVLRAQREDDARKGAA